MTLFFNFGPCARNVLPKSHITQKVHQFIAASSFKQKMYAICFFNSFTTSMLDWTSDREGHKREICYLKIRVLNFWNHGLSAMVSAITYLNLRKLAVKLVTMTSKSCSTHEIEPAQRESVTKSHFLSSLCADIQKAKNFNTISWDIKHLLSKHIDHG